MPKIIIGVGGTGTKIIREISDRWETTKNRPRGVALAVVDARDSTPENGEITNAIFLPNKPINFGDEFREFRSTVEPWWPKSTAPVSWINFSDGCGAIRSYGRFFAFYYASKIRRTIEEATSSLVLKAPGNVSSHGLAFSIIVVGSLGNGTGGGTMLDVATVARHQLSYVTKQITCLGIFIPGSVTRGGNTGFLAKRVAASGFASLLELQAEFNRADETSDLRLNTPYKFVGWSGVDLTEFVPGADEEYATPYDAVLLLDRTDRRGLQVDYPTLINVAAEGISMLSEGGDADNRLVDAFTMVSAGGAKRFGSLGAARITIPGDEMLDFCTAAHAQSALELARFADADGERWAHLLADETPGDERKRRLKPEDADVATSVDFFIEQVLGIKETQKSKPKGGKEFNQLFDRFAIDDERTLKEFDDITDDLTSLKDPKAIVSRAYQIQSFVDERVNSLGHRIDALTDGETSFWAAPQNPVKPHEAGVKMRINRRIMEFVNAGAFGLLDGWLGEFREQIKANKESIDETERPEHLRDKSHKEIDLVQPLAKLRQSADSLMAGLKRKALMEGVSLVRQNARTKLDYHLWDSKLQAVENFYERVDSHLARLQNAASEVARRLNEPRITSRFEKLRKDSADQLTGQQTGNSEEDRRKGIKANIFLGGDVAMRESLLGLLQQTSSTSETTILEQLAKNNRRLFADRLRGDANESGFPGLADDLPADSMAVQAEYRNALEETVRSTVEPVIADRCSIDRVFEEEAGALATRYRTTREEQTLKVNDRKLSAIRRDLDNYGGPRIRQRVEMLNWDGDDAGSLENAIDLLIAGRLQMIAQYATPQWSLSENALRTKHITTHCFITYPSSARRVDRAVRYALSSGLSEGMNLKPQADDYASPTRIDLVFVELGADLEALRTDQEFDDYRWAMTEEKGFTPHVTRQFHDIGLKYLAKSGYQVRPGAAILALAEEYGIVETDRAGKYKLKIPIKQKRDNKKVIYPAFAQGQMIGDKGLENVVRSLESGKGPAIQMLGGLRDAVYGAMRTEASSKGEDGWEKVADRVGSTAARLRLSAQRENDMTLSDILARQADALDSLAAELAESRGRIIPAMFA